MAFFTATQAPPALGNPPRCKNLDLPCGAVEVPGGRDDGHGGSDLSGTKPNKVRSAPPAVAALPGTEPRTDEDRQQVRVRNVTARGGKRTPSGAPLRPMLPSESNAPPTARHTVVETATLHRADSRHRGRGGCDGPQAPKREETRTMQL